jgi:type IV secretory pathway VirD2 relaxase
VNLRRAGRTSTSTHIRYLERDGVTRDGKHGQAYGATEDAVDTHDFEARGREDRHQFRFIVSPEEAADIGELKTFTRDLMAQMERDLGTRLEWMAVDHWDTEHPHTHIVLRGRDDTGKDLVIAPEYIARGMQARARELATEWLGLRTELEIHESLTREFTQERWTSLDASIARQLDRGRIDLRSAPAGDQERHYGRFLAGRLRHLADMGLAEKVSAGVWTLKPEAEPTLRALGERGDIIRTMQRALGQARREIVIFEPQGSAPVTGRIIEKGLSDGMTDRGYVIVDGTDGRAYYARLAAGIDISELPSDGIVELRGVTGLRRVDQSIAELADAGVYRTSRVIEHFASTSSSDPVALVEAHVRRLEALRRAGIVERVSEGVWRVPGDLPDRGHTYDRQRLSGAQAIVRSYLPIDRQARALGATWLDEQLVAGSRSRAHAGFGGKVQQALAERERFLVEQGFAERQGQRVVFARNLLDTLRTRDLESAARKIEVDTGLVYRSAVEGQRVSGAYRRSLILTSGRFAMLDDGVGFSLVPWRPIIESRLGQSLSAVVRGPSVSWELGRRYSISR